MKNKALFGFFFVFFSLLFYVFSLCILNPQLNNRLTDDLFWPVAAVSNIRFLSKLFNKNIL